MEVLKEDIISAMKGLVAAGSRCLPPPSRSLPDYLLPLLSSNVEGVLTTTKRVFPPADKNSIKNRYFLLFLFQRLLIKN